MSERAEYRPDVIEPKWQSYWEEHGTYRVAVDTELPKFYVLDMFPYPSGSGLHVGHVEGYTATDIVSRYKRLRGFNVMHPMGWDAFGLPAEQHAIREGIHPAITTKANIDNFRRQLKSLGFSYDWDREVNTTDPDYYRWTQWIFLQLYKRDLAYIAEVPVNWCPDLGTVLANEEVTPEGLSERGGFPVIRRPMRQWMLKITAYAQRLLDDLETIDWPEHLKEMQRNWIGRSRGAEVDFAVDPEFAQGGEAKIRVFTTRPDTLFGATYMVLAPEHPLVDVITTEAQREAVVAYRDEASRKSELQRTELAKEKTGVATGAYAINPVNEERIPIWVADYVLASYGTGAIMAVPAHDERDYAFATTFELPIREVISGGDIAQAAHTGDGTLVHSGLLDGLEVEAAKERIIGWLEERGLGTGAINYKLRDWLFSRQRYWGEPFPVVHLSDGSHRPLPEEQLPLRLPQVERYEPSGTGESPLATIEDWVHTTAPGGSEPALRETNTMPQWAGSCWYYLRYLDPDNDEALVDPDHERYWMPVDLYVGGAEHAVLHLLYARFWHKVLYDIGAVSTSEPFQRVVNQGMILGKSYLYFDLDGELLPYSARKEREILKRETSKYLRNVSPKEVRWEGDVPMHPEADLVLHEEIEKMAKSRGNVINPDDVIEAYGADALRLYEMFMGPLEQAKPWDDRSVSGVFRFLARIWRLVCQGEGLHDRVVEAELDEEIAKGLAACIKKVGEDTEELRFNTAIAAMMEYVNLLSKRVNDESAAADQRLLPRDAIAPLAIMLSPYAPHMAEELWSRLGHAPSVAHAQWPDYDPELLVEDHVEIGVQVMGKFRGTIVIAADADEDTAVAAAQASSEINAHLEGKTIRKVIYKPGRILNFVVG